MRTGREGKARLFREDGGETSTDREHMGGKKQAGEGLAEGEKRR